MTRTFLDAGILIAAARGNEPSAAGRTALITAHRLSPIRHADRIVILREGRVAGRRAKVAIDRSPAVRGRPTASRGPQPQRG